MTDTTTTTPLWPTAVQPAANSPRARDTEAIRVHLLECRACQGRWFSLACAGEALRRFLAPRLITTAVAVVAVWVAIAALA